MHLGILALQYLSVVVLATITVHAFIVAFVIPSWLAQRGKAFEFDIFQTVLFSALFAATVYLTQVYGWI